MNRLLFLVIVVLMAACDSGNGDKTSEQSADDKQEILDQIAEYEQHAFAEKVRMDKTAGHQLLILYKKFANNYHDDPLAAEYLFKAGEIARNLGKYQQALSLFTNVHDGFPDYDKKVETAFIIAFIYDNDLNDREMAQKQYEKVIEFYPDHQFAKDAQARLLTLYMTDEELIKFFKEKNATAAE
jgi:TolA-binding protein